MNTNNIFNDYEFILNSNFFDREFYLKNYPDVLESGLDPIFHYLVDGANKGYNPCRDFDTKFYLDKYKDVKNANVNPFLHYLRYGKKEGRFPSSNLLFNNKSINMILSKLYNKISIIIPIYNAYDETKLCVDSVIENTCMDYELVLINDCSSDSRIDDLLNDYDENFDNVIVIKNSVNKGFTGTVNVGITNTSNDVILLNSDTIVTENWLKKLIIAAYSDENIGTVTPLSNNAGAFSVPIRGISNEIPDYLGINGMSRTVEKVSKNVYMEVPTANGFCMYIKRETINDVGLFDEINFPMGYGEENDYSLRANEKGWVHIIDDSTFIYHKAGASFSDRKKKLSEDHMKILLKKYPDYTKKVFDFTNSADLKNIQSEVQSSISNQDSYKKRILYVMHEGVGGTKKTIHDLSNHLNNEFDIYFLSSNSTKVSLYHYVNNEFEEIDAWSSNTRSYVDTFFIEEFRDIYFNILVKYKIDLLHIHHLIRHTWDIVYIAKLLNIPISLSLHDFYFICPCYSLLDENLEYCGGICSNSDYDKNCTRLIPDFVKIDNTKQFVTSWRKNVNNLFRQVDFFITASNFAKELYIDIYPMLANKNFEVIEHGVEFKRKDIDYFEKPNVDDPIKILFLGNINIHKGSKIINKLNNLNSDSLFEFHFLGNTSIDLKDVGIHHGVYDFDELPHYIEKIKPSFIAIFSICPETFCYTLSEAWFFNIPVLAFDIGAIGNRIKENDGGVFLNPNDINQIKDKILNISRDSVKYNSIQSNISNIDVISCKDMTKNYYNIYLELLDNISVKSLPVDYLEYYDCYSNTDLNNNILMNLSDDLFDFNKFINNSLVSPLITNPFSNIDNMCFNFMDNIKQNLIKDLSKEKFNPLISIIMPTFNRSNVILSAIKSVVNQTYKNWELLIVDDGSTDETVSIIEKLNNNKITIIKSDKNYGVSHARNLGLANSKGEFIAYLDTDNDWDDDYLESMVGALFKLPDADAIYSGQYIYGNDFNTPMAMRFGSYNKSMEHNCNYIDINCFIHKKNIYDEVGGFDETLKRWVDWDFILKISFNYTIYSIPIICSNYYESNADNRITGNIDLEPAINRINSNLIQYKNKNKNNDLLTNNLKISIILQNFTSLNKLKECISSIRNSNLTNYVIIIVLDNQVDINIRKYIRNLALDDIKYLEFNENKNLSFLFNKAISLIDEDSDLLILDSNVILCENSIQILQNYSIKLDKCGLLIPQQIIPKNNNIILDLMEYSIDTFDCDIALSKFNSKVVNLSIFSNGKYFELSSTSSFCIFIKSTLINKLDTFNFHSNDYFKWKNALSQFILNVLNYKLYYISDSEVILNIE